MIRKRRSQAKRRQDPGEFEPATGYGPDTDRGAPKVDLEALTIELGCERRRGLH